MNSNNLKPESYVQNQKRIHGYSMNLLDANIVSDFKEGRRLDKELRRRYLIKFGQKLPGIIEGVSMGFVLKHADSRADLYKELMYLLEGYPGKEIARIYKACAKLTTAAGYINKILDSA
jgi:hypothetical protein